MKLGAMLGDLVQSLFKRPATEQYPLVRSEAPQNFRGKLWYDPTKCSGCQLCVKDCPSEAIELLVIDKAKKRFVMRYHIDRCTFCAQCVQNCRFDCLGMSQEQWELASTGKEAFTVHYGREEDVQFLMDRETREHTQVTPTTRNE